MSQQCYIKSLSSKDEIDCSEVLKKKIISYRTPKGRLLKVPDELAMELLFAWERWSGPARGIYSYLGVDYRMMAQFYIINRISFIVFEVPANLSKPGTR